MAVPSSTDARFYDSPYYRHTKDLLRRHYCGTHNLAHRNWTGSPPRLRRTRTGLSAPALLATFMFCLVGWVPPRCCRRVLHLSAPALRCTAPKFPHPAQLRRPPPQNSPLPQNPNYLPTCLARGAAIAARWGAKVGNYQRWSRVLGEER